MRLPGSTILAPTIGHAYGSDQPFAWNSGAIGITVSRLESANESACPTLNAWISVERWL